MNIAEAADLAAAEAEKAGIKEEDEEVKISLTMFEDEDLDDLLSEEDETGEQVIEEAQSNDNPESKESIEVKDPEPS